MATCRDCDKEIKTHTDFYSMCPSCGSYGDVLLCGDCTVDHDLTCPDCGGAMKEENEGGSSFG